VSTSEAQLAMVGSGAPMRGKRAPDVGRSHTGAASTQQAFGRFFVDLAHQAPDVAARVVTVSPDVASSTNLGGWINRAGIPTRCSNGTDLL